MKKLIVVLLACIVNVTSVFAQGKDQIVIQKKHYYQNDIQLTNKEFQEILKSDQQSAAMYKKAKQNLTIGTVFLGGATVAVLVAVLNPPEESGSFGGTISDEEMSKWMVPIYISCGCLAVAIPFAFTGKSQYKKSINIYNSSRTTGFIDKVQLDFGFTQNGVGVVCRF